MEDLQEKLESGEVVIETITSNGEPKIQLTETKATVRTYSLADLANMKRFHQKQIEIHTAKLAEVVAMIAEAEKK